MADASKIQLMLEAERRGILPPDKTELLAEARRRGLVGQPIEERQPEPAAMTKDAVPAEPRPEGFFQHLGNEFSQAGSEFAAGIPGREGSMSHPAGMALGALRAVNAVPVAAGHAVGETLQDVLQPHIGVNASAAVATAGDMATSILAPGAIARSAQGAAKAVGRVLPGSQAARTEMAIDDLRETVNSFMPKSSSTALRAEAMKSADKSIPMTSVYQDLKAMIGSEKGGSVQDGQFLKVAENLATKINQSGNKLSLGDVQREISDIGALTKSLASQGQSVNPQFQRIFKSLVGAMEKVPEGAKLREVAQLYRKESAVDELLTEINKIEMFKRGTGAADFNANRFMKVLEKKDFLRESFDKEEIDEIMKLSQKLIEMPAIPAAPSVAAGSGRVVAAPTTALGIESMAGLPPGTISGPVAVLTGGSEILRMLLPTKRGRTILRGVLESGPINQMKLNVLAAAARGITGQNIPPPQMPGGE